MGWSFLLKQCTGIIIVEGNAAYNSKFYLLLQ